MVKIQRLFAKTNLKIPVCRIQKFNMKCEIERMEINYTFYFFGVSVILLVVRFKKIISTKPSVKIKKIDFTIVSVVVVY